MKFKFNEHRLYSIRAGFGRNSDFTGYASTFYIFMTGNFLQVQEKARSTEQRVSFLVLKKKANYTPFKIIIKSFLQNTVNEHDFKFRYTGDER